MAESGRLGFIMFRNYINSNYRNAARTIKKTSPSAVALGKGLLLSVQDGHLGLVLLLDCEVFLFVEVRLLAGLVVAGLQLVLDVLPHRVAQEVYGLLRELLIFVGFNPP